MEFFLIFDHIIDYKLMAQLSLSKDYAKLNPKEQEKNLLVLLRQALKKLYR